MKRQITISLDAEMAHFLEIRAAMDNLTLAQGITELVEFLAERLLERKTFSHTKKVSENAELVIQNI